LPAVAAYATSSAHYGELLALMQRAAHRRPDRVVWNVNSTAKGGGVVELLRPLLGYSRGAGVDGDGGRLSIDEPTSYEGTLAANGIELARLVRPRAVVILHDPRPRGSSKRRTPPGPP
jgi:trehalose synthase